MKHRQKIGVPHVGRRAGLWKMGVPPVAGRPGAVGQVGPVRRAGWAGRLGRAAGQAGRAGKVGGCVSRAGSGMGEAVLGCWGAGVLRCCGAGVLGCWGAGVLGCKGLLPPVARLGKKQGFSGSCGPPQTVPKTFQNQRKHNENVDNIYLCTRRCLGLFFTYFFDIF